MAWQPYHTIWAILIFGWIGNYMVRMALSPLLGPIELEFGLTKTQAGFLTTAFFYAYTSMQIPAGFLGAYLGRKRVLIAGVLLVAGSAILTGMARSMATLFLARFLTGVAQGSYFSNDRPIIAHYTPREKMGLGQGVSFSGLGMGIAIGLILAGALAEHLPWRAVFFIFAALPVAASLLIWWFVGEPPRGPAASGGAASQGAVFRSRDLWLLGSAGIAAIYTQWVVGTWGPQLFNEIGVQGLGRPALYSSLQGIASLPGLMVMGMISDRSARAGRGRKVVMAGCMLAMAGLMLAMGLTVQMKGSPFLLASLVFATSFFMWGVWSPCYAILSDLFPQSIMGTAFGLLNGICFLGSLVAPVVTGWIKDLTGSFAWGCYMAAIVGVVGVAVVMLVGPPFRLAPERPASL